MVTGQTPWLLIDSGTTNTRIRKVCQGKVQAVYRCQAGARDGRDVLSDALAKGLKQLDTAEVPFAVLSGMITSATGLIEIPHEEGPADLRHWSDRLQWRRMSDIWDRPMAFVPGVKFSRGEPWRQDIIRGEETELLGWMAQGSDTFTALHLGSHHKVMMVEKGVLTGSATALTGEMAAALSHHTLLSASIRLPQGIPDLQSAKAGLETAMQYGTARTLFLTRVNRMLSNMPETAAASWFLGALAAEDVRMIQAMTVPEGPLVIYGQLDFGRLLADALTAVMPQCQPQVLTAEQSDGLAVAGAVYLAERVKEVPQ